MVDGFKIVRLADTLQNPGLYASGVGSDAGAFPDLNQWLRLFPPTPLLVF